MKRPGCEQLDEEIQALIARYCQGNGVDLGCGYSKIGACVGIDKVPWGCLISKKDKTKKISQADWAFNVLDLPLKDNTMDFVYGSHILEHITLNETTKETFKALQEWIRILKPKGYMVLIIPDINYCITPLAKIKKLKVYHGLQPCDVRSLLDHLPTKVISFDTLNNKNIFECVLQKI